MIREADTHGRWQRHFSLRVTWFLFDFAIVLRLVAFFDFIHLNKKFSSWLYPWKRSHGSFCLSPSHNKFLTTRFTSFTLYARGCDPDATTLCMEWSFLFCLGFRISSFHPCCSCWCWSFDLKLLTSNLVEWEQVLEYFLRLEYLIIIYPSIGEDYFMTFLNKSVPYEEQVIFGEEFVPVGDSREMDRLYQRDIICLDKCMTLSHHLQAW